MKKSKVIIVYLCFFSFTLKVNAIFFSSYENIIDFHTESYKYNLILHGGVILNELSVDNIYHLPVVEKEGAIFDSWNVIDNTFEAVWIDLKYVVDVNSIIQGNTYLAGLDGFTFDVYINDQLYKDDVIDFCEELSYGTKFEIIINSKEGYSINCNKRDVYYIKHNLEIMPSWIDNIAPTITNFEVINYGFYNPSVGDLEGWNIRVIIHAYDYGSGIVSYENWLVPYSTGMGGVRRSGNDRYMTNVLYLDTGRTFCASVKDAVGNVTEQCNVIKIS